MSTKRVVTAGEVEEAFFKFAYEVGPDYVYARKDGSSACTNTERGEDGKKVPSCIVGKFFVEILGIPAEELPEYGASHSLVLDYSDRFEFTPEAQFALRAGQALQDLKVPWATVAKTIDELTWMGKKYFRPSE